MHRPCTPAVRFAYDPSHPSLRLLPLRLASVPSDGFGPGQLVLAEPLDANHASQSNTHLLAHACDHVHVLLDGSHVLQVLALRVRLRQLAVGSLQVRHGVGQATELHSQRVDGILGHLMRTLRHGESDPGLHCKDPETQVRRKDAAGAHETARKEASDLRTWPKTGTDVSPGMWNKKPSLMMRNHGTGSIPALEWSQNHPGTVGKAIPDSICKQGGGQPERAEHRQAWKHPSPEDSTCRLDGHATRC